MENYFWPRHLGVFWVLEIRGFYHIASFRRLAHRTLTVKKTFCREREEAPTPRSRIRCTHHHSDTGGRRKFHHFCYTVICHLPLTPPILDKNFFHVNVGSQKDGKSIVNSYFLSFFFSGEIFSYLERAWATLLFLKTFFLSSSLFCLLTVAVSGSDTWAEETKNWVRSVPLLTLLHRNIRRAMINSYLILNRINFFFWLERLKVLTNYFTTRIEEQIEENLFSCFFFPRDNCEWQRNVSTDTKRPKPSFYILVRISRKNRKFTPFRASEKKKFFVPLGKTDYVSH